MSIKITWTNDEVVDEIKVYRSEQRIELAALPTPLATIAGDLVEYVDVTARRGTIYYYIVAKIVNDSAPGANDGEVLYSPNSEHGYFPETGHGPNKLKRGNWSYGYFGKVNAAEFLTPARFCSEFRAQTGMDLTPLGTDPQWHKFIHNGKVLFSPVTSLTSTALSWRELYHLGAVFGDDTSDGVYPAGLDYVPTKQDATVQVDGYIYRVRLIDCTTADTLLGIKDDDMVLHTGKHTEAITNSEYFQTMARLLSSNFTRHSNTRLDNLLAFGATGQARLTCNLYADAGGALTNQVWVGGNTGTEEVLVKASTETQVVNRWHPVLELIL